MIDIMTVPQRFKNGIGKAQHGNILHRFLPQIMIDPEDLLLTEILMQPFIQFQRGYQVFAERFLQYHMAPGTPRTRLLQQSGGVQRSHHPGTGIRRHRQIKQPVAPAAPRTAVQFLQIIPQIRKKSRLPVIAAYRNQQVQKGLPQIRSIFRQCGTDLLPEPLRRAQTAGDLKIPVQKFCTEKLIQRGKKFPAGKVTARTKQNDHRR